MIGMLLLPFSTSLESHGYVSSYGLPFITAFVVLQLGPTILRGGSLLSRDRLAISVAVCYAIACLAFSFISNDVVASLARSLVTATAVGLYVCILSDTSGSSQVVRPRYIYHLTSLALSGVILSFLYLYTATAVAFESGITSIFAERYVGGAVSLSWGATNTVAAALLISLAACVVGLAIREQPMRFKVGLLVIMLAIAATVSRNGIVVGVLMAAAIFFSTKRTTSLIVVVSVIFGSLYLLKIYSPESIEFLYETRIDYYKDVGQFAGRAEVWYQMLEYLGEESLVPVGYYGSQSFFNGASSHNILLTSLVEMTLVGLILTVAIFVIPFRSLASVNAIATSIESSRLKASLLACLGCIFLNLQFEDAHFTQQHTIMFWYFLAIVQASARLISDPRFSLHADRSNA